MSFVGLERRSHELQTITRIPITIEHFPITVRNDQTKVVEYVQPCLLQWCPNGQPDYGIDKIRLWPHYERRCDQRCGLAVCELWAVSGGWPHQKR